MGLPGERLYLCRPDREEEALTLLAGFAGFLSDGLS
jgi:hypothetical protein